MRACVFVDGENLRYSICDLFDDFNKDDYLPKNAAWANFYDHVVNKATEGKGNRLRTYWYVVQHVDPYPHILSKKKHSIPDELANWYENNKKLLSKSGRSIPDDTSRNTRIVELQPSLVKERDKIRNRFDGYHIIQDGISQKHKSIEFRRSGGISYNLLNGKLGAEKTVDVNLAVDMVTLSSNYDAAIIVSGDQDYVPAAQAVKNLGKIVINVAFEARSGLLLPGGAKRLNCMTDWSLTIKWDEFRNFMNLPTLTPAPSPSPQP